MTLKNGECYHYRQYHHLAREKVVLSDHQRYHYLAWEEVVLSDGEKVILGCSRVAAAC